ncbi:MAG TPA: hypothetical protein VGL80_05350 [Pseudonocardiaceae bacterium]|jgi:hypothetical protein
MRRAGLPALGVSVGVRVPVEPSPCPLFRLRAPAGLVRTLANTEDFDLRQVAEDRLIAAADSPERTLAAVRSTFRGAGSVELLSTRLGVRPRPRPWAALSRGSCSTASSSRRWRAAASTASSCSKRR